MQQRIYALTVALLAVVAAVLTLLPWVAPLGIPVLMAGGLAVLAAAVMAVPALARFRPPAIWIAGLAAVAATAAPIIALAHPQTLLQNPEDVLPGKLLLYVLIGVLLCIPGILVASAIWPEGAARRAILFGGKPTAQNSAGQNSEGQNSEGQPS